MEEQGAIKKVETAPKPSDPVRDAMKKEVLFPAGEWGELVEEIGSWLLETHPDSEKALSDRAVCMIGTEFGSTTFTFYSHIYGRTCKGINRSKKGIVQKTGSSIFKNSIKIKHHQQKSIE